MLRFFAQHRRTEGLLHQFLASTEQGWDGKMTSSQGLYQASSIADLNLRTDYEAWLLEAVYEIVELSLAARKADDFIYPPNGGPPRSVIYGSSHIRIGDWRGGFLKVGAPLVFVTAFKILDMVMEWVLAENGVASTYKYAKKIRALKGSVQFPSLVETHPWLRERLCALYEQLEPLRGTIIHERHFTSSNGTLQVSSSKHGKVGPTVTITAENLRNLALVLVSVLRYMQGTWAMDTFEEKRLRRALDEVAHLHKLPMLGQLPPQRLKVQLCVLDGDPITFDVAKVRADIAKKHPTKDTVFDVLLIAVARDGTRTKAYLVPWDQLQQMGTLFERTRVDLASYEQELPADVNVAEADELNKRSENASHDCQ